MRQRLVLASVAVVAVVVVLVAVLHAGRSKGPSAPSSDVADVASCLAAVSHAAGAPSPTDQCPGLRTALDAQSPTQIDVQVLVPDGPDADDDADIITQAISMWSGGLDALSGDPSAGAAPSSDFHVTVDRLGTAAADHPLIDPEIVIVAANPLGSSAPTSGALDVYNGAGARCDTVADPFAFDTWTGKQGWDSHHGKREGTYLEDCGGGGGNVCFAINGTLNPAAGMNDVFDTFGLFSDEFGHCLALGTAGDPADGAWPQVGGTAP